MIRVLIVATYASVRAGLHALLADTTDWVIVGSVGSSADLEGLLTETRPDVVLLDVTDGDQARVLPLLAETEIGVVVLGDAPEGALTLARSSLPAWAYLSKEAEGPEIAAAVRAVATGLIATDRAGLAALLRGETPGADPDGETRFAAEDALTAREREVLQAIALGLPNKAIAARLGISTHTVKFHVAAILAKLGAASRTEAVTLGIRRGDVTL
jgi:DNA-binding NarL/FixJ family response regulator